MPPAVVVFTLPFVKVVKPVTVRVNGALPPALVERSIPDKSVTQLRVKLVTVLLACRKNVLSVDVPPTETVNVVMVAVDGHSFELDVTSAPPPVYVKLYAPAAVTAVLIKPPPAFVTVAPTARLTAFVELSSVPAVKNRVPFTVTAAAKITVELAPAVTFTVRFRRAVADVGSSGPVVIVAGNAVL